MPLLSNLQVDFIDRSYTLKAGAWFSLSLRAQQTTCYVILSHFGFHPTRTQDGVLFFLPENVVKNAPDNGPKLLPFPVRCLLIHGNDLSFLRLQ
jgi:hypothetical protein